MGDTLATSATGSVHARLASGLGIALEPGTQVRLAMLDGAGADAAVPQIAMDRGRMSVRVYEARTVILAGAYRIEVEVASFAVDLDAEDGALTLDVREGAAHVVGPSTDQTLTGPAHFPEASAALEASEPVGTSDGYGAQPLLHVARPGIVRWEIADVNVRGAGDLAMRVGVGPTTISGWDAHGRMFRAEVDVTAGGLDLTPDELMPEGPRVHAGYLEVREITPVVREHQAAITRCYEHAMRASPPFSAHVRAVVSIELTGAVESVRFSGDPIPASMQTCMTNQIGTWIFPPPHGGAFTLPIPFNFGT